MGALLAVSAVLLAVAPLLMPASYSWIDNGISESAAQGVDGSWAARMGFLVFGLAVIWLSSLRAMVWQPVGRLLHLGFGICMLAVAAFSSKPWAPDAVYLTSEDLLHSVFASIMGFAFIVGTTAVLMARRSQTGRVAWFDATAVAATSGLSLGMGAFPDISGSLQRLMFLVAYGWYGREAIEATGKSAQPPS